MSRANWNSFRHILEETAVAITATEARRRLIPLIEQVNDDQAPVEILSTKGTAFLVSEAQFRSLEETTYLLRSPANAERLVAGLTEVKAGRVQEHEPPQ